MFSNASTYKINTNHGFMQQDMSPVSCEGLGFFAAKGVGPFNVEGSWFRISYNSFHTFQNSSAPMPIATALNFLVVSNPLLTTDSGGRSGQRTLLDLTP